MDRSNQHRSHDEETMDWLLDAYWDRQNAGTRPTPADRALDPALSATVRHLHAHDDAPGPDRAFVRRLRKDLTMTTAEPIALSAHPYPTVPPNSRVPAATARPHREPTRWRPALELIAAAALILAMIGGYFGSDRIRTELGGLVQTDDAPGAVGMLHGNAARTGEMPGPGPEGQPVLRWRTDAFRETAGVFTDPIVAGDTIYLRGEVVGPEGTNITTLNAVAVGTGEIRWIVELDGLAAGTPAVANGLVYIGARYYFAPGTPLATPAPYGTSPGALIAFDAATGEERWRYTMGGAESYSPVVADGVAYINSEDGSLHAVDALTGEPRWLVPVGSKAESIGSAASPAVADGVVYTANNQGVLYALDAATGNVKWVASTKGDVLQTPAVTDGAVYVANTKFSGDINSRTFGPENSWLSAFDAASGDELWSREVGNDLYGPPAVADGRVFLTTGSGGALVAYDAETGNIAWTSEQEYNYAPNALAIADGVVYAGSFSGSTLYAIDATSGQDRWSVQLGGGVIGVPTVVDGMVIVSARDEMLYALGGSEVLAGTPVGTPLPESDASGLPPCDVEPRPAFDTLNLTGEPAASLVPVTDAQRHGQPAAAREGDLPTGSPADAETVAAIKEMLTQANACYQRGRYGEVASFVSDDFLRRPWVAANVENNDGYRYLWSPPSPDDFDVDDTRVLPDGRTAVLIPYDVAKSGLFLIFVEQDGHWLLDERIEVTETPEARG